MEKSYVNTQGEFSPHRGSKVLRIIGMTLVGVAFAVVFALVFGLLVKILWNWLMPSLFGITEITYWQAFGIVVLFKLLFGGFGPHHKDPSNHFPRRIHDKWHNFIGIKKDDDQMIKGWKHYKQYWHDEGKDAFEDYLRRMEEQKEKKSEE